jgi:hypothetical protein
MEENCFVIMAISDQKYEDIEVTFEQLKSTYDNVIKAAIQTARPRMNILRADECAVPGTITTDILTNLMFNDFVVADVTFPNPNVYYELGLRHCFRTGTILIKNADIKIKAPFDISHQRYIEYECTPKGIQTLARQLKEYFNWYERFPNKPDNQVLHLAQLIKFAFPNYGSKQPNTIDVTTRLFTLFASKPELMDIFTDTTITDQEKGMKAVMLSKDYPEIIPILLELGQLGKSDELPQLN